MPSFDVVSELDKHELTNAVDNATKELERQSAVPARGVLLPIAHATTLAGSATLIGTSSNLLIAGKEPRPLGNDNVTASPSMCGRNFSAS